MRTNSIPYKREMARAAKQVQAMVDHAELGKGMPYPADRIEAVLAALNVAMSRRERTRVVSTGAVAKLAKALSVLRKQLRANVSFAASELGHRSAVLAALGGKPKKAVASVADVTVDADLDDTKHEEETVG